MHQKAGQEAYGADIPTTRDYRSLLDRKDVDAVIVAVADFQHRRVVLDCVAAGKDVYCEKPMSHNVADGLAMVEAVQKGKRIFQAGSQRVSNIVYKKAAEIYKSGRLGEVTYIEAHTDRNSPSGAWVYPDRARREPGDHRLEDLAARCARAAVRCGAFLPLALLCRLRRGRGGRPVRAPAFRHSMRQRHQCHSEPRLFFGQPDALQRRARLSLTCWRRSTTIPA